MGIPKHFELISERAFTAQVIKLAQVLGWKAAHFRPAQNRRGEWSTAVQGDGAGFPDLVLVHRKKGKLIFAELKSESGKVEPAQNEWLTDLTAVMDVTWKHIADEQYVDVHVWRPSMIEEIEELLR